MEEVYFGEEGILKGADPGTYLIDMTTTSPELAKRIYEEAGKKGCKAIDAPVTGGDTGAREGTLTILAGGDQEDFDRCLPVFEAMGKAIRYTGGPGNGQHTKCATRLPSQVLSQGYVKQSPMPGQMDWMTGIWWNP